MEREAGGRSHQELLSSPLVGSSHHFPRPRSPSQVKQRSKMDSLSLLALLFYLFGSLLEFASSCKQPGKKPGVGTE